MKHLLVILPFALGLASCKVPTTFIYTFTAAKYYNQGDYANAIQYYLKAVSEMDQRAETFYWLAMSYYKHGDVEDAMYAMERSLEKDPTNVVMLERLAAINLDLANYQEAVGYCRKAISLDEDYVETYNTLGHAFFEWGRIDSAEVSFKQVLTLSESLERSRPKGSPSLVSYTEARAEATNGLGEIYLARRHYYRALNMFNDANSLAHDWETPWLNKARAYEGLGNLRAAEVAYERAIDLAPDNTAGYRNLARLLRRLNRNSEAITMYRKAVRIDTMDVESYYGLAELYELRGDNKSAADIYGQVVDKASDDPKAYSRAGRANMFMGNYDLALEFLKGLVELQPEKPENHNALGEAYAAVRDTVLARKEFEASIEMDSLYTTPIRHLGEILLGQGKEQESIQCYLRAARLGDTRAAEFLRSRGVRVEDR